MTTFSDLFFFIIGGIGATAKYFNDVGSDRRVFKRKEFFFLISSSSFSSWLTAKIAIFTFAISNDAAFVVAGAAGILGFGFAVQIIDKFMKRFFSNSSY